MKSAQLFAADAVIELDSPGADELVIAFGSCNDQNKAQPLWQQISKQGAAAFIWLGDNVYADTDDMQKMAKIYAQQKQNPEYQRFVQNTAVFGTWDDHDYGVNDGGASFAKKQQSAELLLDFLDVPADNPAHKREGVYQSYLLNTELARIKLILLDTRYFRSELNKQGRTTLKNDQGTVLGQDQWQWLEQELQNNDAELTVLASSIQVLPSEHRFEKWDNFPKERKRLLDLLHRYQKENPKNNLVIISGDRHMAEISQLNYQGLTLTEITSSSLTHGFFLKRPEQNSYRVGKQVYQENYGVLRLHKSAEGLKLRAEIHSQAPASSKTKLDGLAESIAL